MWKISIFFHKQIHNSKFHLPDFTSSLEDCSSTLTANWQKQVHNTINREHFVIKIVLTVSSRVHLSPSNSLFSTVPVGFFFQKRRAAVTLLCRKNCVNLLWCLQEVIIENGTLFIYRTGKLMLRLHSKAVKLLVANHLTCLSPLFHSVGCRNILVSVN